MVKENLAGVINSFREKNILVLGDLMLDKYLAGRVERISPEAPVPVVKVEEESYTPGGAANVASNTAAYGSKTAIIGVAGKDDQAGMLKKLLEEKGVDTSGIIQVEGYRTTEKIRVMAQSQQLLRFDYENGGLVPEAESMIIEKIKELSEGCDAIIISDYNKGLITQSVAREAIKTGKPVIVDPKPENIANYKGALIITPNEKEALEASREKSFMEAGEALREITGSQIVMTRGAEGMSVFSDDYKHLPTKAREVYDVTGAGDTVAATLALGIACGLGIMEAASLANHAAGIVVGKLGSSTVSLEELAGSLENGD